MNWSLQNTNNIWATSYAWSGVRIPALYRARISLSGALDHSTISISLNVPLKWNRNWVTTPFKKKKRKKNLKCSLCMIRSTEIGLKIPALHFKYIDYILITPIISIFAFVCIVLLILLSSFRYFNCFYFIALLYKNNHSVMRLSEHSKQMFASLGGKKIWAWVVQINEANKQTKKKVLETTKESALLVAVSKT